MAKFANVTYGTNNPDGKPYTYVVNDNVRTGDLINPSVRHAKSGVLFATTARVKNAAKTASKLQQINPETNLGEKGLLGQTDEETRSKLVQVETGKELGISKQRGAGGQFSADRSTHDENGNYIAGQYETATRGGNVLARQQQEALAGKPTKVSERAQKAIETFESYSKKFKGVEE